MNQSPVLLATEILLCTMCKSDQWETEFLYRPAFPETLIGQKQVCWPYGHSFRFSPNLVPPLTKTL